MKTNTWRLIVIAAVLGWALFNAWPRADEGRPYMNMNLGLDLKGGSHLVMRVVTDDALRAESNRISLSVIDELAQEGYIGARAIVPEDDITTIQITGLDPSRIAAAETFLDEGFESWSISSDGATISLSMSPRNVEFYRDQAVKQALTTIRGRIDEFGVAEPNIQRLGGDGDRILVELPGVEDPSRVKKLIQLQALLELRLLYYPGGGQTPVIGATEEDVLAALGGTLPPGVEILPETRENRETGETVTTYYAVERTAAITGADLQNAYRDQNRQTGLGWVVAFQLRVGATDRFASFTRANRQKQMAIVLDGAISSAPVIESEIGSHGVIQGRFTAEEADDLALVLRAGALPATVVTIEERTVGPSLGQDSIRAGVMAASIGFLLVMAFMLVYYKLSGVNAVVALLFNLVLVAAAMASMGASLTVPGIAGFILTVGMAVDANVLVFERIREELRTGKTVKGALEGGFGKALSAILDANVTTLIAALFLFQYGTGPVRGFAVTLSVGILASLFTAIFVSRTLFGMVIGDRALSRLSI